MQFVLKTRTCQLRQKLSLYVEICVYWHHIPDYSSDVISPIIGWRPGLLPGWLAP